MLEITQPAENRVDIAVSGTIDGATMRRGLDELIALSEGVSGGRMLYTLSDFALPTMGALGIELTRLPALLSLLSKYERCAVVADAEWLRRAAEIEGALIPGLLIRGFRPDQRDAAEAWLAETG